MKATIAKSIVIAAALSLGACASNKWNDYQAQHGCQPTEQLLKKNISSTTTNTTMIGGFVPMSSVQPTISVKTYRLYQCSNGTIWGPA